MSGEDALGTLLEGAAHLLDVTATVGPWVLLAFGLVFVFMLVLVVSFFISTWRSINRDHARMDAGRARVMGRGFRG